jgi:small subunit ribosomal protein S16
MLKIKLTRTGKTGQPNYRIVVIPDRSKRDGEYVANLGYYIPKVNPAILKLDIEAFDSWISKGAIPTDTVAYLRSKATSKDLINLPKTAKNKHFKEKRQPKAE